MVVCPECSNQFNPKPSEVKRGGGKFCSGKCSSTYNGRLRKAPRKPNTFCGWCQCPIYKTKSKIAASKSGITFCNRHCKDRGQRLGGVPGIHPPHYGTGDQNKKYRQLAFKWLPNRCAKCSYDKYLSLLEVNHKDLNRNNGNIWNLEILCVRCHGEWHFETRTGRFSKRSGDAM